MKTPLHITCSIVLALSFAGTGHAVTFNEEYSAQDPTFQLVSSGQTFHFGFDFHFANNVRLALQTNSNLSLTQDAVGAFGDYASATLTVEALSGDPEEEEVQIQLFLLHSLDPSFVIANLGTFTFNPPPSDLFFQY